MLWNKLDKDIKQKRTNMPNTDRRVMFLQLLMMMMMMLMSSCDAHVSLYYPPARTYAIDFLDNARTTPPCGMARGGGPVTDLLAGSTIDVSWYLGYAHTGGYRVELLTYDVNGSVSQTYNLTSPADGYVGADNITTTTLNVTLPTEVTSCQNCTLRLIRQGLNWGESYIFWSCADINILPIGSTVERCQNGGQWANETCQCVSPYTGSYCQFRDECSVNSDCGVEGECKFISQFSYPQKQCYCKPGWYGIKCDQESSVKSTTFDESQYQKRLLSPSTNVMLYYRILETSNELEVVLQANTDSFIGFGWKPQNLNCVPVSQRLHSASEPEGEGQPEGEGEPEGTPEGEGEPESGHTEHEPKPEGPGNANGMDCADIVIGAAIGTLSRVRDYYTTDRSTPRQDEFYGGTQSLTAAIASQTNGVTTVIFRRPIMATETTDHTVENGLMTVIWSHGQKETDTSDIGYFYKPDEIKYHGIANRGKLSLNFYDKQTTSGSWSTPSGCVGGACDYRADWSLDVASDVITFTMVAKQSIDRWTGIAFAPERRMKDMDAYIGFVGANNAGVTIDGWTSSQHTKPVKDTNNNMRSSSVTYSAGFLTLTFQRSRDTGDSKDWKFSNSDSDCYYFMFPVGGGPHTDTDFSRHGNTPSISSQKICIKTTDTESSAPSIYHHLSSMSSLMAMMMVTIATVAATIQF